MVQAAHFSPGRLLQCPPLAGRVGMKQGRDASVGVTRWLTSRHEALRNSGEGRIGPLQRHLREEREKGMRNTQTSHRDTGTISPVKATLKISVERRPY